MSAAHPLPMNRTSRSGRCARSAGSAVPTGGSAKGVGEGFSLDLDIRNLYIRPVSNDSALYWQYMKSLVLPLLCVTAAFASDIESRVKHGYADSNGVKIHYAS